MARLARVVAPGLPHHVTQRGNRRQETFFSPSDYRLYRRLMAEWCGRTGRPQGEKNSLQAIETQR
jgi:putative transposase